MGRRSKQAGRARPRVAAEPRHLVEHARESGVRPGMTIAAAVAALSRGPRTAWGVVALTDGTYLGWQGSRAFHNDGTGDFGVTFARFTLGARRG